MSSGFDTLNSFKPELSIKPIKSIEGIKNVSGGTFKVDDEKLAQENAIKDDINLDLANQMVDETPMFAEMADNFVASYIPVRQASEENASFIAQQMGLGKRVTFEDARSSIEQQLGPLPKTSQIDKTLNILVDSINARTPYRGAAGVFDILAQIGGKYLNRETAEKSAQISHGLKIKELAINQMQEQNAAILEKEAEFSLKKMGMDDEYLQKFLDFNKELQLKAAQFEIDTAKAKQKAALDLYANPDRLFQNITFVDDQGKPQVQMSKKVYNPEKGTYEFMLPRRDETGDVVFDVEAPPGAYLSPLDGPQTDAELSVKAPNFSQAQGLIGDFDTLDRAGSLVEGMFEMDEKAIASGESSRFGVEGAIDKFKQETMFTLASFFNAVNPGSGDRFVESGNTLYEKDQVLYPLPANEEEKFLDITFKAPKKGMIDETLSKIPGVSEFEDVTRRVSIDDFFGTQGLNTYRSLGYSDDFARMKVQENLIIYALARALKPTGRLNVDDIKRASDLVNLQGFTSPEYVRGQLKEILRFIRRAQVDIYSQGATADGSNIFNQEKYAPKVERYKDFLGEDVQDIVPKTNFSDPNLENPPAEDPQATEVTYDENIFGGSGI